MGERGRIIVEEKFDSNKRINRILSLYRELIKKYGKPLFYIGDGDIHISICKKLKIPCISVNWVSKAKIKGDYDIETIDELKEIIK